MHPSRKKGAAVLLVAASILPGCSRRKHDVPPANRNPVNANGPAIARKDPARRSDDAGSVAPGRNPPSRPLGAKRPVVRIETTAGNIWVELRPDKAPNTVANFLRYVRKGFYNGTIFHKVIPKFIIQGGGYTPDLKRKGVGKSIPLEAGKGLLNTRGAVSLARMDRVPHSGAAEFFINLSDNLHLDPRGRHPLERGYAVFGRVISGMRVADNIAKVKTCRKGPFSRDVPCKPLVIKTISRVK